MVDNMIEIRFRVMTLQGVRGILSTGGYKKSFLASLEISLRHGFHHKAVSERQGAHALSGKCRKGSLTSSQSVPPR